MGVCIYIYMYIYIYICIYMFIYEHTQASKGNIQMATTLLDDDAYEGDVGVFDIRT